MALRSHCSPKTASSAPTTSRSAVSGSSVIVGPSAATMAASTSSATAMPWKVDRHSRVRPAASTMVSASIASTAQATKTVRMRGSAVTGLLPGLVLEYSGDGQDCRQGRGLGLAAAHLPGTARAHQAALHCMAADKELGRHLLAELGCLGRPGGSAGMFAHGKVSRGHGRAGTPADALRSAG